MGEEVLSPTSPDISYNSRNPYRKRESGNVHSKDRSPSDRRLSLEKQRSQDRSPIRARLPGLNVITNFSRPPALAQRAVVTDPGREDLVRESTANTQAQAMTLPSRAYSGPRKLGREDQGGTENRFQTKSQGIGEVKEAEALSLQQLNNNEDRILYSATNTKGPVNALKRKSNRRSEVSPSDRIIAIGLSVTPTSIAERMSSPESAHSNRSGLITRQYPRNQGYPSPPSIIVTPAKEVAPWSTVSEGRSVPHQPRPASSVYLQATHRDCAATQASPVPPVPILPDSSLYQRLRNASEPFVKSDPDKPLARAISTCTTFEEDGITTDLRDRSDTVKPQLRLIPRLSIDSTATRHSSQGWWNYIISPFSAKPNTPMFPPRTEDDRDVSEPNSPHSSDVTRIGEDLDEYTQDKKDGFSPPMRDSVRSDQTYTSIETDGSYPELACAESSPAPYDLLADNIAISHPKNISHRVSADLSLSPEGFGAAAEYYRACWHDQNSPTPYFECQNHTCLPFAPRPTEERALNSIPGVLGAPAIEAPRNIASDIQDLPKLNTFQQTPSNRFSAAFKQAVTPKARPVSEGTVIEDVDTTPAIEEAHAAPVIRAPPPVLAPQAFSAGSAKEDSKDKDETMKPPGTQILPEQRRAPPAVEEPQPAPDPPSETAPSARNAPVSHAVAVRPPEPSPTPPAQPPSSETKPAASRRGLALNQPTSPEPIMPATPRELAREQTDPPGPPPRAAQRELPSEHNIFFGDGPPPNDQHHVYIVNHYHGNIPPSRSLGQQHAGHGLHPPPREKSFVDENRENLYLKETEQKNEKKKLKSKRRGCVRNRTCVSGRKKPMKKKKKCLLMGLALALILLIVLILVLAMTLTRKGDQMPVQTQFLNLTGFPPMPTGISTIIDPDAVYEQSGCVSPTTMWSCALPKEQQASVAPNNPDQPNFRVEIRFQNGTNVSSGINGSLHKRYGGHVLNGVTARSFVRRHILQLRDTLSSALFTPSPPASNLEDQTFLGRTTDNVTAPFDGEITPFFMSFESANKLSSRLTKRVLGLTNSTNSTDPLPDLGSAIPAPDTKPDGTAAPANLLPFPSSQPLRLFDRGRPTEHYGFYTYFDRSIFLASNDVLNTTTETVGNVPGDENGGAVETAATVRCTWTQTRFLVQIWTNLGDTATLLAPSNSSAVNSTNIHPKNLTESSANNFSRPGSFPYPVSITLDRHGGDIKTKDIFCYGMNNRQRIILDQKKLQIEDRSFQGQLVNPALGPFEHVNVSISEGGPGGIDGGTGGCGCVWRNWQGAQ